MPLIHHHESGIPGAPESVAVTRGKQRAWPGDRVVSGGSVLVRWRSSAGDHCSEAPSTASHPERDPQNVDLLGRRLMTKARKTSVSVATARPGRTHGPRPGGGSRSNDTSCSPTGPRLFDHVFAPRKWITTGVAVGTGNRR